MFLAPELDGGVFAHFSAVEMEDYKTLAPGQTVDVEVEDLSPHFKDGYRYRAIRVRVID